MVVCSFTDVTDRKAAEAQLHWLAYHDSLTGLGNRSLFNDELERELLVSMQTGHQPGRPVHRPRPVQAGQRLVRSRQPATRSCWPWPSGSSRRSAAVTS